MGGYVRFLARRRRLVVALALALTASAFALAARLELKTNPAELLPSGDPAVVELERLAARHPGTAMLQIAIESPDRAANLRFADALTQALRRLPADVIATAGYHVKEEQAFFRARKWLYATLEDLEAVRAALKDEIFRRKNPLAVDLDDSDDLPAIRARAEKRAARLDRFPSGIFEGEGGRLVVVVARPPGGLFAERAGERLVGETRRLVAALGPERFHPALRVGLTGDVMAQLEERQALESDLAWATAVCVVLVALVVGLYFRRAIAVPLVGLPAVMGVAVAFAWAELAFGYLNASTAFLGSIVVGNGINFPIILLARYEEERRAGASVEAAIEPALRGTMRPTLLASLGAAVAYGSLLLTRFRGFSQFGAIGGVGMVAAWAATVTVLPALLVMLDARRTPRPARGRTPLLERLGARVVGAPRLWLLATGLVTLAAILPLPGYLRDPFEYDFRNLRNRRSLTSGAGKLAERVDPIFGITITPSVVLTETRAQAPEVKRVIVARDRARQGRPLLAEVMTLEDFLPGDAATQARKLAILREIRELAGDDTVPADLRPVTDAELPAEVRRPFTELDGTLGRVVLVYHGAHVSVWDGLALGELAALIEEVPLPGGAVVRSSGQAVVFTAMIRSIVADAPRATAAALAGVALLAAALLGLRGGAQVLAVLACGVVWMLGCAALAGVRTNFLNFIALPITVGIGADYAVNVYLRARREGDVVRALGQTGGAVFLCSLTTIIGYGALLAADNQALESFGALAILGEAACLLAALIALPALLGARRG